LWGRVLDALGGRRDGDVVLLPGGMRLRLAEDPRWDFLPGGALPALVRDGGVPVAAVADIPAVYGGAPVLLVDLRAVPGRGARVGTDRLGPVLAELLDGSLGFDELVRGMDRYGTYQGDGGAPATPTPTAVVRTGFPPLPAGEAPLLVRTDFTDDRSWRALVDTLDRLGQDTDETVELGAVVVDELAFEHLQPQQVPALVPPDEHTVMVALADATTLTDPAHPLLVVDLYDTPGQVTRVPVAEAGSMAANLEISNMDFADFG
jgi:hypothetical protein